MSFDRLRPYRDELTRALNRKIQSGVDNPQALVAFARSLQIVPLAGTLLYADDVLLAFGMFSQPRASDYNPIQPDPAGSFIDVEQLSYYVWLNAEKNPAYRNKTLYLLLAKGVDEMLAIRSDVPAAKPAGLAAARLADVHATMAHWLGVPAANGSGRPIASLVS